MADKQQQHTGAAAATVLGSMPVFSVEQIELIRRLRNSGITKEQMVQVFESLDRLEHELGVMYSIPISLGQFLPQFQQFLYHMSLTNAFTTQPTSGTATLPPGFQVPLLAANSTPLTLPPDVVLTQPTSTSRKRPAEEMLNGSSHSALDGFQLKSGDVNGISLGSGPPSINGLIEPCIMDDTETPEMTEFVKQGETLCSAEIRNFVVANNVKQQQVATLAGVSQSYVSRYLKGECYEMSARSRRAIQKWYLQYKNNPAGIVTAYNSALLHGVAATKKPPPTMVALDHPLPPNPSFDTNAVLDMMSASMGANVAKRERFVFRPNHLDILEQCFVEDNYPSHEKREELAKACNGATEMMLGRTLADREKVTAQIVANWFANKRKELKKMAKDEGCETSPVASRPRGRPSRLLINGVESSTGDGGSGSAADNDNDSNMDSCDYSGSLAPGQSLFPDLCDEQALSMSVELAAVNQAILSLTGQQPLDIKLPATAAAASFAEHGGFTNGGVVNGNGTAKLEECDVVASAALLPNTQAPASSSSSL